MRTYEGKVAIITGAAGGMGRGIAETLLDAGMQVVITDVEEGPLAETASQLGVLGICADVTKRDDLQTVADQVLDRFGSVHVVCNNAGVGPVGAIADMTLSDWRWVLDVNLWGVINGIDVFLPLLKRNEDGGHIVNTSSQSGLLPGPGFGAYTVSKYGVVGLTEVLAQELVMAKSLVKASVLLPGPTQTRIATSTRNRPKGTDSNLADLDLRDTDIFPGGIPWRSPRQIGEVVLEGLGGDELYLFTHPEASDPIWARFDAIRAASDRALARLLSKGINAG